jgi:uncharacterized membrane protein
MIRVSLFMRKECKLCDEVKIELEELKSEYPHELVEVDIDSDPILQDHYAAKIPVLKVGPYTLEAPFDETQLRVTLAAAQQGRTHEKVPDEDHRERAVSMHKVLLSLSKHWLAIFNLLVFMYVGLPFAAPVMMEYGATRPARWIYALYSPLCHQLAFRSWFLFGEQPAYPLEIANSHLGSYGEVTGMNENDQWEAREFTGNDRLGYKVALCERDVAIYGGIFLSGLLFAVLRKRIKPLPIGFWILIGILPIAIDGGSQLLAQLPLGFLTPRESTPFLRTLTGLLFGVANVWLAYPYLEETMQELRVMVSMKLAGAGESL